MISKPALRRQMAARRRGADPLLGARLVGPLLASGLLQPGAAVAGYWPLRDEIDVRPVLVAAIARGHTAALPVSPAGEGPLGFRRWTPETPMRPGRFGTSEPEGEALVPAVLLLPLLAFDRRGGRLGYGGGFYDRTLAALGEGAVAIGCGYAMQEVDSVPGETHDRRMAAIATEAGVFLVE